MLAAFGRQLRGDQRVELAARLPHEAAVSGLVAAMILAWPVQVAVGTPPDAAKAELTWTSVLALRPTPGWAWRG